MNQHPDNYIKFGALFLMILKTSPIFWKKFAKKAKQGKFCDSNFTLFLAFGVEKPYVYTLASIFLPNHTLTIGPRHKDIFALSL